MNKHGGARRGAGRPRKWSLWVVVGVGQACQAKWYTACSDALEARRATLPYAEKIRTLHKNAQSIPVKDRKDWLGIADEERRKDLLRNADDEARKDELENAYEAHRGDFESWLHAWAGTPFNEEAGTYQGEAPRGYSVSDKPPKGTRLRIIKEVAMESGLNETEVDNLWQAYRRLEREIQDHLET